MSLFAELRRRNVFRVGVAYAVVAWLLMQVADLLFPVFGAPDWALRIFIYYYFSDSYVFRWQTGREAAHAIRPLCP